MKVMFVCLGNICRSPAAEAMLRKKAAEANVPLHVESSGLGDWHVGQLADPRTRDSASRRGLILSGRAKKFETSYFDDFDYILAVDHHVLNHLKKFMKPEQRAKLKLITHFSSAYKDIEVPDPFYGSEAAFEEVLDILEDSCEGFIKHIEP